MFLIQVSVTLNYFSYNLVWLATKREFANGRFLEIVCAGQVGEVIGVAEPQGAWGQLHRGGYKVHHSKKDADVFEDQLVGDALIFPGDALEACRQRDDQVSTGGAKLPV